MTHTKSNLTRTLLTTLLAIAATVLGCGGGSESPAAPTTPVQSDGSGNGSAPPAATSSIKPTDCAFIVKRPPNNIGIIQTPEDFSNTPRYCDYFVSESLTYENTVTIAPGTVFAFAPGIRMNIRFGGKILAVGNENERIVFRGLEPTPGSWESLSIFESDGSRIEYVDFQHGGGNNGRREAGTLEITLATLTLVESTVSSSISKGVVVKGGTKEPFSRFERNRFNGNALTSMSISGNALWALDAQSDYIGEQQPNGTPYLEVDPITTGLGYSTPNATRRIIKLNAPLSMDGILLNNQSTLIIDAGVSLQFSGPTTAIKAYDETKVQINGTAQAPVTIKATGDPAPIWLAEESSTQISNLRAENITFRLFDPVQLDMTNVEITNSKPAAISCISELGSFNNVNVTHNGDSATVLDASCQ